MPALPPLPRQFSADVIRSDDDEGVRLNIDGQFQREETIPKGARAVIFRPDKRAVYTLDHESKTYFEVKIPKRAWEEEIDTDAFCAWTQDGTQKINGRKCLRFIGQYPEPSGKAHEVCFIDEC